MQKSNKPPYLPLIGESTLLLSRRSVAIILSLSTLFLYGSSQQTHLTFSRRGIIRMMGIALSILSQEGAYYFEQKPTLALYALPFIILGGVFFITNLELKTNLLATAALFGAQHLYLHSIHRDLSKGILNKRKQTEEFREAKNKLETEQNGIVEDGNGQSEKFPVTLSLDPPSFTEICDSENYLRLWEELEKENNRAGQLENILSAIAKKLGVQEESLELEPFLEALKSIPSKKELEIANVNRQVETLQKEIAVLWGQLSSEKSEHNNLVILLKQKISRLAGQNVELKIKAYRLKAETSIAQHNAYKAWVKCRKAEQAKEHAHKERDAYLERLEQKEETNNQLKKKIQEDSSHQLETTRTLEEQNQLILELEEKNREQERIIEEYERKVIDLML